jgi:hypothetical protein
MGTTENRARYNRAKLRYPSDATEEEGADRGPYSSCPTGREQADGEYPRSPQWALICVEYRMSVAGGSDRPSSAQYDF